MFRNQRFSRVSSSIMLCACLMAVTASRPLLSQDEATIRNEFRNPGKQYRPMVRWWWPGADVADKELEREIGLLDAAGFGGAEIQPFVTFDTRTLPKEEVAKVNDYATPSFFQHVRAA